MFSEISSIRIEFSELFRTGFSVTLQTHTNTVPLTFLWHRFCSIDHRTFSFFSFSLSSNGFPIACFRCFLFEEQNHHEKRATQRIQNTVGTPNCPVFSFVVFEKSEILWFGSSMSIVSWSLEVLLSNSLGSQPVLRPDLTKWHKLLGARAEWRMTSLAMEWCVCDGWASCLRTL